MAMAALRSRRLLPSVSALISRQMTPSSVSRHTHFPEQLLTSFTTASSAAQFQSRSFKSTPMSFLSSRNMNRNDRDDEKLDPDAILFEGCDYNHWLITMEFPKDPKPSPEEMVETYVQTCAKGLNISVEEAKKKIYACSTTTYQGFQAIMTEAESEQFQGLPGVVFILPDSYIDPVNKEYGGDKYINGTIIPRPPPVQYNRGRSDRSRPRYDNSRGPPGNFNNQQGPMQGDGRSYAPPQNIPQQSYGPPRGFPQNSPPQNYGPPGQIPHPPPPPGGFPQGGQNSNFNQPGQGNYYLQEQRAPSAGDQRGFGPSGGFQNFGPGAGARVEQVPNQGFGARAAGGYTPGAGTGMEQGQGPSQRFGPGGVGGNYGPRGREGQVPGQGFGPDFGGGYAPGSRGEHGPAQGSGPGATGGYAHGTRGEHGPNEGFTPGGNFGPGIGRDYPSGNQGR